MLLLLLLSPTFFSSSIRSLCLRNICSGDSCVSGLKKKSELAGPSIGVFLLWEMLLYRLLLLVMVYTIPSLCCSVQRVMAKTIFMAIALFVHVP